MKKLMRLHQNFKLLCIKEFYQKVKTSLFVDIYYKGKNMPLIKSVIEMAKKYWKGMRVDQMV